MKIEKEKTPWMVKAALAFIALATLASLYLSHAVGRSIREAEALGFKHCPRCHTSYYLVRPPAEPEAKKAEADPDGDQDR